MFMRMLEAVAESPLLTLVTGVIMIFTGCYEIMESADRLHLGAHHGVAVFGVVQVLRCIPELVHGIKEIHEARC